MKALPLKTSFNGGELSPRLGARTDETKYGSGVSSLENFIPTVQGPIIRRGGNVYVHEVKTSANRTWLIPFQFNVVGSYALEIGDQYMRFYTNRGIVTEAPGTITGITQANPGVVHQVAHGYSTGNEVFISGVLGMTQINGHFYRVVGIDADHYSLKDVDGNVINTTTFTAYASGGTAQRVYEIATPYHVADLTDAQGCLRVKYLQSQSVLYLVHGIYPMQVLSRFANTNWTIAPAVLTNGPFQDPNKNTGAKVYVTPTTTGVTGAANNGSGLIRLAVSSTTGIVTGNTINVEGVVGTTEANGVWTVTLIDATHIDLQGSSFVTAYSSGGTVFGRDGTACTITASQATFNANQVGELFYLEKPLTDATSQWTAGKAYTLGARVENGFNTYICIVAGTSGSDTPTHTQGAVFDGSPGCQWLFEDSSTGVIKVTAFSSTTSVSGTIQTTPNYQNYLASNQTYIWAHGLYSVDAGFPEAICLFRDRVTMVSGIKLALSAPGDYLNFPKKIGGQVTANCGIVETLPTSNPVRWMQAQNDLLIGTGGEEILVTETDTTQGLSPSNIKCRRQTSHGSRLVDSVPIEFVNMFVTRSGQQLRAMVYNWNIQGYEADDMTIMSEHIPKGIDGKQGIVQMSFAQEPDTVLWCTTTDGRLIGFTYNQAQEVFCWHRHPLGGANATAQYGNATAESICVIPSPDGVRDDPWMIVQRTINGVQRRYIEWQSPYFTDQQSNIANAFYVDAGATYNGALTSTITGLYHLVGQTCDVLADGGTHPQRVVSAAGTISLQVPAQVVQVGLPCPAKVITMRPDAGSQIGSAQGSMKRIFSIVMRFIKTLTGEYGPPDGPFDEMELMEGDDDMDTPMTMIDGDYDREWPGDNETDNFVCYQTNSPLPATLVGFRLEMETQETTA